jgi:hypothetical protein
MDLKLLVFGALIGCCGAAQALRDPPFLFTRTPRYEPGCADRFPRGGAIQVASEGGVRPLVPQFAASADPAMSFDGRRVLFAGKQRASDSWQIWETPLTGGTPRRLTRFREDAVAPLYAAGGHIVYARRTPSGFQIETALIEGGDALRLTYSPGDYLPTAVLRDGRVLFEGPHPGTAARDLFTVYLDGSGVETYRCDHRHDRSAGLESSSGDIIFVAGGQLARFTSARAIEMSYRALAGEFGGRPSEIAAGELLAGFRPEPRQPYAIYRWKPGQGTPEPILSAGSGDAVQPVLIRPHDPPKRHPSGLGDRAGANLLCLNVYTSKSHLTGPVAAVRVWALDDSGAAVPLGHAPVESDGSFFVQVPADRGIRFDLLDRAGKTVEAERTWIWARRGEQRVCVGCHAGPERAPENAVPRILLRSADPTPLLLRGSAPRGGSK